MTKKFTALMILDGFGVNPGKLNNAVQLAHTPNLVEVWPSLIEVGNWSRDEEGIGEFSYVYQMAGFKFKGSNRDSEFVRNKRIVTESTGGMDAVVQWDFEPVDGGTHVIFNGDYSVSIPLIGQAVSDRIAALNAIEIESLLHNMKDKLER